MKPENFSNHFLPTDCRVSVIIQSLNEEKRVSAAIESALDAVRKVGGEVILADCCSADRTVELAMAYPIRIVQLAHANERCQGIGPQLGYQHSRGEFIYALDADMQMVEGFLEAALDFMRAHPDVAGVGGKVVGLNAESLGGLPADTWPRPPLRAGAQDRLDGGGLYRRSAIETAGYFSDRNLHSHEEFELAVRLRSLGWKLWRLSMEAARHTGPAAPPYRLLMRRWHSRHLWGLGELLRACAHPLRLKMVFQGLRELWICLGILGGWALWASMVFWPLSGPARLMLLGAAPAAALAWGLWRQRSLRKALYSSASWGLKAAGLVRGMFQPRRAATLPIASLVLREPRGLSSLSTPNAPG